MTGKPLVLGLTRQHWNEEGRGAVVGMTAAIAIEGIAMVCEVQVAIVANSRLAGTVDLGLVADFVPSVERRRCGKPFERPLEGGSSCREGQDGKKEERYEGGRWNGDD